MSTSTATLINSAFEDTDAVLGAVGSAESFWPLSN